MNDRILIKSKTNTALIATALLFVWFLIPAKAIGQDLVSHLQQGFQSPEAATLGKFGDIPVSYYSGTPNITIPVYTVQSGNLEMPISLRYHASGIKVDEISGWTGLGWALNAGGVITRTIRGHMDEDLSKGYLATAHFLYDDNYWPIAQSYIRSFDGCFSDDLPCLVQHGVVDTEPDLYFYNFNGHAGSFVRAPQEIVPDEIITIPYKNLDIIPTDLGTYEWTITTQDGTRYIFGSSGGLGPEVERIFDDSETYWDGLVTGNNPTGRGLYNSGWWLREIHPVGSSEPIRFYYERVTQQADWRDKISESEQLDRCIENNANFNKRVQATKQKLTTYQPYLTRIETSGETISFVSSEARQDQPFGTTGLRKLEEIKVLSKDGTLKKHMKLGYGYFNSGQADAERLRLESITEVLVETSVEGHAYNFEYIDQYGGASLPAYGSFDKDHWGYYNAAGNTNSALPEVPEYNISGANRMPNASAMKAGLLTKIKWPTGGVTHFTYEPHDYSRIGSQWASGEGVQAGGVRVKTIRTTDGMDTGSGLVEHFSYRLSSDPNRSSGVVSNEPINFYKIEFSNCPAVKQRSASSYVPLGSLGGRYVGYSEVQVSYGDNGDGGKKIFHYTSGADYSDIAYPGDLGPAFYRATTSNEWRRGHLLQSETYSAGGVLLQKQSTYHDFNAEDMPLIDGQFDPGQFDINYNYPDEIQPAHPLVSVLRASSYAFPVSSTAMDGSGGTWYISYAVQNPYYLVGGWNHPDTEHIDVYDTSGENLLFSTKRYLYEKQASSPAIGQLREVEETGSGGLKRTMVYEYAHEQFPEMNILHMLSQPYGVSLKDASGTVLQKSWTMWGNSDGFWRPRCEIEWDGEGNPETLTPNSCQ